MKRKLDDIGKKLSILYDLLRESKVSGAHACVKASSSHSAQCSWLIEIAWEV